MRVLEFSYEGMRRQDQIRFGTYTEPTTDRYAGVHHNVATGDYVVDNTGFTTVLSSLDRYAALVLTICPKSISVPTVRIAVFIADTYFTENTFLF